MKIKVADRLRHVEEYYFSRKLKEIAEMRSQGLDIINLGIGSPDLSPSSEIIDRLGKEAKQDGNHGYQPYIGIPAFRLSIADWYQRKFDVELNPNGEILPLIGSKEGIMHISMTYLQSGDQVLVPNPGYPSYRSATLLSGAEPIYYHLTESEGWLPDLDHIKSLDLSRVKIMWLNYPHMPTGAKASPELFTRLVKLASEYDILLCHDNPYAFILNDNPMSLLSIDGAKNVALELSSMSKTYNMAGWRVGYLAGHEDRISEILRFKSNVDSGMFKPVQMAAIEALNLGHSWHNYLNDIYTKRRLIAGQIFDTLSCRYDPDQVGLFLWGRIPTSYNDGISMANELLKQSHVFITPGNIFGSNGNKYVRISLCSDESTLNEALRRINSDNKNK